MAEGKKLEGRLAGQVALVTGASRGIGRAIALELAGAGAAVVLAARSVPDLEAVAAEIDALGGRALVARCDVRRSEEVQAAFEGALTEYGRLDVLVNDAGVAHLASVAETNERDLNETLETNLKGAFLCCRAAVPVMTRQARGVIVNISSGAGRHGVVNLSAYCASKFGLIGLTEALALELEEAGVRVYAVCPAGVDTRMWHRLFPGRRPPLRPEHIARRVLELCLPGSPVPTGSAVEVYEPFPL